jgi:hypothetical protein
MQPKSPPQLGSADTAHVRTWSTKNWTSAQPCETQFATQVMLKAGGSCSRSMHWKAQVTISKQVIGWHCPQSCGQMPQVSKSSQTPFGHTEQTPQSCWHDAQVSPCSQTPLPHPTQMPQSAGHTKQFSFTGLQTPLPQLSQRPQSGAQFWQSSPASQKPFPQF